MLAHAQDCVDRCRALALHSEEVGFTTRTFLSPPMHAVHRDLRHWTQNAQMEVTIDAAGNLRGYYAGLSQTAPVLWIGSHLDTVPHAGAFDGILGVVIAVKLVELLKGRRFPFAIETVGFSEEEGVRFGFPFIGSRALTGDLDDSIRSEAVAEAIRGFGLDPERLPDAANRRDSLGYLEFHIEQGPVLESLGLPLAVVDAIAGQSRMQLTFEGRAGHAGTTPMRLRHDALAGAAEWILAVEEHAGSVDGLVATVGRLQVYPGATNVIPGSVNATLDVRHGSDAVRRNAAAHMIEAADIIALQRGLSVEAITALDQAAVPMDPYLTKILAGAMERSGVTPHHMPSGAGHDAMVMARSMPAAMLFVRSPGGLSHHPDESVLTEDVAAALAVGLQFLEGCA